jgi:nitrate/nitrite-specific signal transduction histidine kinase
VGAGVRLELGQDVTLVALDRLLADEQLGGHVRVRHAVREQLQDLALAEQLGIAHRLKIELDVDAGDRLGSNAQIALYTIIRESLELAIRRGPRTRISVAIAELPDGSAETLVTDDGVGERRRRAFEAIEERVRQLHGTVSLDASADGGTELRVVLPSYTARR